MQNTNDERRREPRSIRNITVVVKGRDSADEFWKEATTIETLSKIGAGFELEKEVQVGRVISLIMNMPMEFRCYDHDKKMYRVWGLVQYSSRSETLSSGFHTGVAFIGKHPPDSYLKNPMKSYRVVGMDDDGFWSVGESKTPFVSRAHFRFSVAIPVKLSLKDAADKQRSFDDEAVTENISEQGASVFSGLEAETGDAVVFEAADYNFRSAAIVRNRQIREGGRTTIHIEFTENQFPVKEASLKFKASEEGESAADTLREDSEDPDNSETRDDAKSFRIERFQDEDNESSDEPESEIEGIQDEDNESLDESESEIEGFQDEDNESSDEPESEIEGIQDEDNESLDEPESEIEGFRDEDSESLDDPESEIEGIQDEDSESSDDPEFEMQSSQSDFEDDLLSDASDSEEE